MMDAISSIGSAVKSGVSSLGSDTMPLWQKILGLGAAGSGVVGNILASNKRNQVLNQQLTDQQRLMALAQNPTQLATNITQLERPLTAGLTSSVGNAVQGYLAERGLSQAPGIQAETLAQGLAPFQQQQQQMAIQAYMQMLGLPAQASARFLPYPQSTPLASLFQSIFKPPLANPAAGVFSGAGAILPSMDQLTSPGLGTPQQENPQDTTGDYNFGTLTPPNNNGGFNWMDLLSPNGLTAPAGA